MSKYLKFGHPFPIPSLTLSLFVLTIFFTGFAYSQAPPCLEIEWSKNYGGGDDEIANEIIQTQDNGFLVVGFSESNNFDVNQNYGQEDFWVLKIDSIGQIEWEKNYGGSDVDKANSVVETPEGDFLVVGSSLSIGNDVANNYGEEDIWLIKINPNGDLLWEKNYGGSQNENAEDIQITTDGALIISGYSQSSNGDVSSNKGDFDFWIFKTDALGNMLWEESFGGSSADWGYGIKENASGQFIVAGSTFSDDGDVSDNNGFYDFWVIKVSPLGELIWEKNFGGITEERAYALTLTDNEDIILAGTSISGGGDVGGNNGGNDAWFIKLNQAGDLIWSHNYGGVQEDRSFAIENANENGFISAGFSRSFDTDVANNYGGKDGWITKLYSDGNLEWEKNFGGTKEDRFYSIQQINDGGYVACGFSYSDDIDLESNYGNRDFWVIKMTPDSFDIDLGNDTTICLNDTHLLNGQLDETFSFEWQDGSTDTTFLVDETGEFWVKATRNGCTITDTIWVDYVNPESVALGNDSTLCEGETLILKSELSGAKYLWQNGDTTENFQVEENGLYWLEIQKGACAYRDSIVVNYVIIDVELGNDTLLCEDQKLNINAAFLNAEYFWQDGSVNQGFTVQEPGLYFVEVSVGGCSNSDSIKVDYQNRPEQILPTYTTICENEVIQLDLSEIGAEKYLWSDNTQNSKFQINQPGKYLVDISINDCIFSDELLLKDCENCLFIPNAFSPNADGRNDVFMPLAACPLFNYAMYVYDRWGKLIFESNTIDNGWKGDLGGRDVPSGSYQYIMDFDIMNNNQLISQHRQGVLILIR
jgi:gliding motility-associated-like protein